MNFFERILKIFKYRKDKITVVPELNQEILDDIRNFTENTLELNPECNNWKGGDFEFLIRRINYQGFGSDFDF